MPATQDPGLPDDLRFAVAALEWELIAPRELDRLLVEFLSQPARPALARWLVQTGRLEADAVERIQTGEAGTMVVSSGGDREPSAITEAGEGTVVVRSGGGPEGAPRHGRGAGRYADLEPIARGGMGAILAGTDTTLGRRVAVKVLHGAPTPDRVEQFVREARVTGQLEHPSIVPVHELGWTDAGEPYLAMKLVQGASLAEVIARHRAEHAPGRTSGRLRHLLEVFSRICEAVAFAHSRGVVHRDLKPANVMIGEFGEVQVMDWGLARIGEESSSPASDGPRVEATPGQTVEGTVMGTPAYMPPEQAEGRLADLGPASDVYSLGAILYEMLTLEPPYTGSSLRELLRRVVDGDLEPPSQRAPDLGVPWELEAAVTKAMAVNPGERYADPLALRADVDAYLHHGTLTAARYKSWQRGLKWVRRHKAISAASATALAVALVLWAAFALRARAALRESEATVVRQAEAAWAAYDRRAAAIAAAPSKRAELLEPGGNPRRARVDAYHRRRAEALEVLDRLAAMAERAPTARARAAVDRDRTNAARRTIALEAAATARELGDSLLARVWVGRAVAAGLAPAAAAAQLERIDAEEARRIEADRAAVRKTLAQAATDDRPGFLDHALVEIARHGRPEVVQMLLDEGQLTGGAPRVRRLAIRALGRIGDTATEGGDGHDTVERLVAMLERTDPDEDLETAVALAEALGDLRDPRAIPVLHACRRAVPTGHLFWQRSALPFGLIEGARDVLGDALDGAGSVAGQYRLGEYHARRGELQKAVSAFDEAHRLDPSRTDVLVARGTVRHRAGDPTGALADYEAVIARRPDHAQAHANRGNVFQALGRLREALESYDQAVALAPQDGAIVLGRGSCRLLAGDLDGAQADYDAAVRLAPKYPVVHFNRAILHRRRGNVKAALADLTRALELDPRHVGALVERSEMYRRSGDPARAEADATRALEIDPRHASAYRCRAMARSAAQRTEAAIADARRAIAVAPTDARHRALLGDLLHGARRYREAAGAYGKAIELEPKQAGNHLRRGDARIRHGDLDGAMADFRQATKLDPRRWEGWSNLGIILRHRGRVAEAREALEKAISLAPPAHRTRLRRILAGLGG